MNMKYLYRFLSVLVVILVLCPMLILPGAAQDPSLSGEMGDAIQDAVGGIVNDAIQDATDNLEDQATDMLGNIGEDISGIADSLLSGNGVSAANELLAGFSPAILLIVTVIALLLSLFGYRLLKIAISLLGFTAGWMLGMTGYAWLAGTGLLPTADTAPTYVPYIVYAVCGILCSVLAHKLFKTGIFIAATAGTFLFLCGISDLINPLVDLIYPDDLPVKYLIARILLALLVGLLSRALTRPVLIATTAAAGGMVAGIAVMVTLGQTENLALEMVIGIVLTMIGIAVQGSAEKKHKKHS